MVGAWTRTAGRTAIAVAVALLTVSCVLAPTATAKKKKKRKTPIAATASSPAAITSGTTALAAASCPAKTHITGGGFTVAPSYDPSTNTGLRNLVETSTPAGNGWNAYGSALTVPSSAGSLTAFARCEGNDRGRIAAVLSSTVTVPPSSAQSNVFNCPPGTHVISGGYAGDGPTALNTPAAFRIIVLGSHRTGPGQWTIDAYNRTGAPPSTLTTFATCELNGKSAVLEANVVAPIANDQRSIADATCPVKTHVVSGGFAVTPTGPGQVPVVGIDENQPVGGNIWHIGLYESPQFSTPPSGSLTASAYCKANSTKKKKKKK